ncbi:hypothetical protein HNR60_001065 [Rhodopseudomonas rhenobacensis]|uniref:Uncharacterized protein n=1 Tax=Rhodopseudomonas rhenobacensis TaxID=87461 RepID=A0A7W7Z1Y8_9BRAD|nr:hypothetical protein [Rhodopseudomonas rhenobacensis]MBB5046320.1 hypothetical protein [Rhodopseudomonas rhenobacensis]
MSLTNYETPRATPATILAFPNPASGFRDPDEVLRAPSLSRSEKRATLSSWASDAHAVDSKPWLRLVPGHDEPVALAAILEALRRLDDDPDPPPNGGMAIRLEDVRRRSHVAADAWQRRRMAQRSIGGHYGLARRHVRSVALP